MVLKTRQLRLQVQGVTKHHQKSPNHQGSQSHHQAQLGALQIHRLLQLHQKQQPHHLGQQSVHSPEALYLSLKPRSHRLNTTCNHHRQFLTFASVVLG